MKFFKREKRKKLRELRRSLTKDFCIIKEQGITEVPAVAEPYFIMTHVKNKESKKQPFCNILTVIISFSCWKKFVERWLKSRNFFRKIIDNLKLNLQSNIKAK